MMSAEDNRNLLIATILALIIVAGFQYFVVRPQAEAMRQQLAAQQADQAAAQAASPADNPTAKLPRDEALALGERVPLATPRLTGSINLTGGQLDDVTLKDYHLTPDTSSPPITLLSPQRSTQAYYVAFGWLMEGHKTPDDKTLWQASGDRLTPESPVTLTWNNGQGLVFERRYAVDENYLVTVTQTVRNTSGGAVGVYAYGLINRRDHLVLDQDKTLSVGIHTGGLGVFDGNLEQYDFEDLQEDGPVRTTATDGWVGFADKYWLVALLPGAVAPQTLTHTFKYEARADQDSVFQADILSPLTTLASGSEMATTTHVYVGAKEVEVLDAYSRSLNVEHLDKSVDFGWFYIIAKPLFVVLYWIYELVGQMWLAIVLLTILIRGVLLYPLNQKSYRSMQKMRDVGPKMQKLKERYPDDPMARNQAMMELYRKEKINPMSGCLPLLIQIPVFFALYKVFLVVIEMRHAPFFGWINDLSAPDPTNVFTLFGLIPIDMPPILQVGVWPIIMGVTMYLQQRYSPKPQDPIQARMFTAMPIIFTFLLAKFPVALVIYYSLSNLLSLLQQWLLRHHVTH